MNNRIFIGIDPSLTGTGVVARFGDTEPFSRDLICTAPRDFDSPYDRIDKIVSEIDFTMPSCPALVCIEEPFIGQGNNTMILAALAFAVRRYLWQEKIPFISPAASQLKKFVTGSGKGDKAVMIKEVYRKWNFDTNDDNLADACGLAYLAEAIYLYNSDDVAPMPYTVAQMDVVAKMRHREGFNLPWSDDVWQRPKQKPRKKKASMMM